MSRSYTCTLSRYSLDFPEILCGEGGGGPGSLPPSPVALASAAVSSSALERGG